MPKTRSPSVLGSGRVLYLPTARIRPNPMQPRKHFDTGGLQELAGSIRQYGVLQPLTVRKAGGAYELVAGERRLRAARLAGLTEVPCLLADVDEEASGMLALVENLQRRDLDYIEEAEGLQKLMQQYHLSQEQAARRIGKSQSAVANKLRILRHPPSVLQALREHHLTERHARALLRLPDEEERLRVIGLIVQGEWTVAKTEQYIDARLAPKAPQRRELGTFVLRDVRVFLSTYGGVDNSVHYFRDEKGLEVDLIVEHDGRWGAIEVKLSDAKADDGARNLKALERKVLSNPAAQNAAPAFLAVVVGKGSIAYTRDDGVAVIPMAALGA